MIRFYKQFGMDIILMEGVKYLDYPKIVLLKDEADYSILDKLSNIRAIGGYVKPNMETNHFIFSIESCHSNKQEIIKLLLSAEESNQKWPGARTAISHRIGRLDISDVAVAIAVSTPHRDAAFKASRYAIERIKEIVPIWKKEHWEDGTEWLGDQLETTSYKE